MRGREKHAGRGRTRVEVAVHGPGRQLAVLAFLAIGAAALAGGSFLLARTVADDPSRILGLLIETDGTGRIDIGPLGALLLLGAGGLVIAPVLLFESRGLCLDREGGAVELFHRFGWPLTLRRAPLDRIARIVIAPLRFVVALRIERIDGRADLVLRGVGYEEALAFAAAVRGGTAIALHDDVAAAAFAGRRGETSEPELLDGEPPERVVGMYPGPRPFARGRPAAPVIGLIESLGEPRDPTRRDRVGLRIAWRHGGDRPHRRILDVPYEAVRTARPGDGIWLVADAEDPAVAFPVGLA